MRNHIHLVLEPTERGGTLAEIMKGINLSYAQYYKNRYKSIIISKDSYLLACGSYVELSPVRAKIVKDPKEYKWSSYNAYAYGKRDLLVDEHQIYTNLSTDERERRNNYREFVKGMMKEKKAMKGEMERRVIYGSDNFMRKLMREYNVEGVVRPKSIILHIKK